jgi:hypothetical protein
LTSRLGTGKQLTFFYSVTPRESHLRIFWGTDAPLLVSSPVNGDSKPIRDRSRGKVDDGLFHLKHPLYSPIYSKPKPIARSIKSVYFKTVLLGIYCLRKCYSGCLPVYQTVIQRGQCILFYVVFTPPPPPPATTTVFESCLSSLYMYS